MVLQYYQKLFFFLIHENCKIQLITYVIIFHVTFWHGEQMSVHNYLNLVFLRSRIYRILCRFKYLSSPLVLVCHHIVYFQLIKNFTTSFTEYMHLGVSDAIFHGLINFILYGQNINEGCCSCYLNETSRKIKHVNFLFCSRTREYIEGIIFGQNTCFQAQKDIFFEV